MCRYYIINKKYILHNKYFYIWYILTPVLVKIGVLLPPLWLLSKGYFDMTMYVKNQCLDFYEFCEYSWSWEDEIIYLNALMALDLPSTIRPLYNTDEMVLVLVFWSVG